MRAEGRGKISRCVFISICLHMQNAFQGITLRNQPHVENRAGFTSLRTDFDV